MPTKYVQYALRDGAIGNWLVAGPQAIPVDLDALPAVAGRAPGQATEPTPAALAADVLRRHWEPESGITQRPVERGPVEAGRFQVGDYAGSWSYVRCGEDNTIDHSGGYPTCHYLRSWAYAELVSAVAQEVTLRLGTHGGATVWLGGGQVFRVEPPASEEEDTAGPPTHDVPVTLGKGATPLLVRFEGAGIRETAHVLSARICRPITNAGAGGHKSATPTEGVRVRIPTLIPRLGRRNAFEELCRAAFVDRDVFEGETPIVLRWPEGERAMCPAHARLQSPDEGIYALGDTGGAPGDSLNLGFPAQHPAGPLRITLLPSPDEVYKDNIRITHHIPLWSMGRHRYAAAPTGDPELGGGGDPNAPPPTGDQGLRRGGALLAAAHVKDSPFAQLARMALGAWADVDSPALVGTAGRVARREHGSNLLLIGLLGALNRFGDDPQFRVELRQSIESCALGYRYWSDDPGRDVMDFDAESDRLLFHACEVLAGQRFTDRSFADGNTGAWHRARGERLVLEWLAAFGARGSTEWGTPGAIERQVVALSHLSDLAEDQQVYELASVVLDKVLFLLAVNSSRGTLAGAGQRHGAAEVLGGLLQPTAGISRLLWGAGIYNQHVAGLVSLACAAGYEPPPILDAIATDAPEALWSRERHAPPGAPPADLVTYKTPDYVLSSAQDHLPGAAGRHELAWRATFGPQATVFVNHPGSSSESDSRVPGFWAGNARLPRVAQWKDALVAIHRLPANDGLPFTHAYFPTATFDEHALRGGWAFARSGGGYLALTCSTPFRLTDEGRYAHRELRAPEPEGGAGGQQTWLVQMGRDALDGDFATFQERVLALPVSFGSDDDGVGTVSFTTLRGDALGFGWDAPLRVDGEARPLHGRAHIENPYATAELPCATVQIRRQDQVLELDFTLAPPTESSVGVPEDQSG